MLLGIASRHPDGRGWWESPAHSPALLEPVTGNKVPGPHLHPPSPGQLQEWLLAKAGVRLTSWQGARGVCQPSLVPSLTPKRLPPSPALCPQRCAEQLCQQIPAQVNRCEEDIALSPLMDDTADGRQPVDAEGVLSLPRDHGWDWDGRRLLALAPALVHQVQVAMHPGHLVGGEGVGAVIIWGNSGQDEGGRDQLALSLIPESSFGEP